MRSFFQIQLHAALRDRFENPGILLDRPGFHACNAIETILAWLDAIDGEMPVTVGPVDPQATGGDALGIFRHDHHPEIARAFGWSSAHGTFDLCGLISHHDSHRAAGAWCNVETVRGDWLIPDREALHVPTQALHLQPPAPRQNTGESECSVFRHVGMWPLDVRRAFHGK